MSRGRITHFGRAEVVRPQLGAEVEVENFGADRLILPGFIDAHAHYPQTSILGAYGEQLIDWLNKYSFVAEQHFADKSYAREAAQVFLRECLRAGTTTAAVFCSVHPESVEAFFEVAEPLGLRMIAGKLLMDRNAPEELCDSAQSGYEQSKALIEKWHGRERVLYAITPRFAPTSTSEQLRAAAALWREHPGTYVQSHVAETPAELAWVKQLFPDCANYLDVYERHGLLGPRAVYGHGIWLSESELQRCFETNTALAHCPTSNLFLGAGLFDLERAKSAPRPLRIGLGSDIGAGTSFSMLQTLNEAYKVAQLQGQSLSAGEAFYLATRGGAQALCLEDKIGSLAVGMEADVVVLDLKATPLLEYRMRNCADLQEALFVQMTLGDDRSVLATYVAGRAVHRRDEV
jgi:guanine deaminase